MKKTTYYTYLLIGMLLDVVMSIALCALLAESIRIFVGYDNWIGRFGLLGASYSIYKLIDWSIKRRGYGMITSFIMKDLVKENNNDKQA